MLRELLFALTSIAGLAAVVAGVSTWSLGAALVVAGLGVIGLGVVFLTEVGS